MKTYAYLILAVLVCSILIQPLMEIAHVCKDRIEIGAAITNSVRAAKNECYSYHAMRDLNGEANREVFVNTFARIFADSLGLSLKHTSASTMVFESKDGRYNDFKVTCSFMRSYYGNREQTNIVINSTSDYKFKTKYLRDAQNLIKANSGVYKLNHERRYNLKITN
ncbi:MAG: hypothetical protein IJN39_05800 [Clostridia bacterium]|nr:hypothetical protein [Clostridia bacterium]